MRIGIDCRTMLSAETGELAGTAHYTDALVRHLTQWAPLHAKVPIVFVLFFDARVQRSTSPGDVDLHHLVMDWAKENVEIVFLPVSRLPLATTHLFLSRALTRAKLDLFHSPAHPLPLFYRGKMIYTVHDLAIYDHPEWFPGGLRQWFATRVTVPRSIRRATKLIAPSESTKRDIMRIFNVPEEKIKVIYEGKPNVIASPKGAWQSYDFEIASSSDRGRSPRNDSKRPYFLFIGTIEPRKNLVRLIDAFIQFRQTAEVGPLGGDSIRGPTSFRLILAGGKGWKNDEIFMAIERANLKLGKGSVQYLGYVSEEEKIALLKNATAFVWPSLYEGFGLPVLEAMAAGVPVITSNTSSIPEITGDAALLIDPEHACPVPTRSFGCGVEGLVGAMQRIASDEKLREQLKTRGMERAKKFTWEKAARETLAVYQDCGIC